jgi:hypothetical protein
LPLGLPQELRFQLWQCLVLQMFHRRCTVDQPLRSSRQVVDALVRAVDLAALFVFHSEASTCHRDVSWGSAFQCCKTCTLTRTLTLCPGPSPNFLQEEIYRLKGELLLQQSSDNQAEAEACFHHAIEIAHTQQAKSFELKTATSLARLWQQQGKSAEARAFLALLYDWFTEGFDTADLQEAKALLEALA